MFCNFATEASNVPSIRMANIPKQVTELASKNGYNAVELAGRTGAEIIYSVECVDENGMSLPMGLPCYIIDRGGQLSLVHDTDFHITDAL